MKKPLLLLIAIALACVVTAQSYDLQYIITQVNAQADLTEEQRFEIISLTSTYYPQAMEIQNSKEKDEIKLLRALALKKQIDGDLKEILTTEQYKQYQEMCDAYEKKYVR